MPLTVLHVNTEHGWRGGEIQTLHLARGLERRGHRSLLAVQPGGELGRRAAGAGLCPLPIPMRGELDLLAARRIARVVRTEDVDLLHLHTAHAVSLGALAGLLGGRRPAVAARRVSFPLRGGPCGRLKYTLAVDRIIAVSESIRRSLVARGIPPERVHVIHSGIDPDRFRGGDRAGFRATIGGGAAGLEDDAFLVGTAAHLAAHKGIDKFLEAAAIASRSLGKARFVIVGRGEEEAGLRQLADRLGLEERVVFAGFREDMPDVYAGLDLFVLSSLSGEGSPAVLKEAMAAGVPVAATALDGVREIVEDGRHGLLAPPGDVPALARAIVLLAADPALRSRLREEAVRKAGEFTIERMIDRTEEVYRSMRRDP